MKKRFDYAEAFIMVEFWLLAVSATAVSLHAIGVMIWTILQ